MRILLVDDNNDILELVSRVLEISGHQVILARDGLAALQQEAQNEPDVIVCDVNLPHLDGWEVCRRIKARRSVPIMLLTVRLEKNDFACSQSAGADDHVAKPFDIDEFLMRLDRLIAKRSETYN